MKTNQLSTGVNLVISIGLVVLAAVLAFRALTGMKIPLITSDRTALLAIFLIGFAMCGLGISRISATGQWSHPLTIIGYVLGLLAMLFAAAGYFGSHFAFVHDPRGAMIAVLAVIMLKLFLAIVHRLI